MAVNEQRMMLMSLIRGEVVKKIQGLPERVYVRLEAIMEAGGKDHSISTLACIREFIDDEFVAIGDHVDISVLTAYCEANEITSPAPEGVPLICGKNRELDYVWLRPMTVTETMRDEDGSILPEHRRTFECLEISAFAQTCVPADAAAV
jgi:hypothetical protein